MSEFGGPELEAVKAVKLPMEDTAALSRELALGHEEDIKAQEARARQAREEDQLAKDIERVEAEMTAIQAIIDDEQRNARDQERLVQRPELAPALNPSIAIRTEELRQKRLALPASLASADVAGLEAALVGKRPMLSELQTRKAELESKLQTVTGSI